MAETIGLKAVLDVSNFQKGLGVYASGIAQMNRQTSSFVSTASSQFVGLGQGVMKFGAIAGGVALAGVTALGAGITAFATSGINKAIDLDQQMANLASTMGKTKDEIAPLKQEIFDLALDPNLVVNTTQAADAIQKLAQNGLTTQQIIDGAAKSTIAMANATGADFTTAANIATGAMDSFNLQASDLQKVADGITGVLVGTKFGAEDYSGALAQAGGIMGGLGVSIEDFNTVLAASASSFSSGSDAGTSFKTLLQRFSNPTDEAKAAMEKYGISLFDATGKMRPLSEVAQQLNNVFQGTVQVTEQVGGATKKEVAAAATASKNIAGLSADIATNEKQLQLYNDQLALETQYYGDGSPKVRQRQLQIEKLTNTINDQKAKMGEYQSAIAKVDGSQVKTTTSTVTLTEAQKAQLATVIGGADSARTILALSKLNQDEFNKLSGSVNDTGQSFRAAATRVDSLQGAFDIFGGIIEAIQIQVGEAFLPVLRNVTVWATDMATKYGPRVVDFFTNIAGVLLKVTKAFSRFGIRGGAISILGALGLDPQQIAGVLSQVDNVITTISIAVGKITGAFSRFGVRGASISILGLLGFGPDAIATIMQSANQIIGIVSGFVNQITGFLSSLSFNEIIGALTGIGAVLTAGVFAALVAGILSLLTPINLIIAGAALLGAAWAGNWGDIQGKTFAAWAVIQPVLQTLIIWLQTNIPIAIQILSAFWTNTLLPALTQVGAWISGTLLPVLGQLWGWLQTNIPVAITYLVGIWNTMLLPALLMAGTYITGTIIPVLTELWGWLQTNVPEAVQALANVWTSDLLPALTEVWQFIAGSLLPLLLSIGNLVNAVLNKAIQAMAAMWRGVLLPALQNTWQYIQNNIIPGLAKLSENFTGEGGLGPVIKNVSENVLPAFKVALDGIKKVVDYLTGAFNAMASAVNNLQVPENWIGNSPSPFEIALVGIANAAGQVSNALNNIVSPQAIDKILGLNRNIASNENILNQATKALARYYERFNLETGKRDLATRQLGQVFQANQAAILASSNPTETFRQLARQAGALGEGAGFSGTPGKVAQGGFQAFLDGFREATTRLKKAQQEAYVQAGRTALTIGNQLNDIVTASADILDERIKTLQDLVSSGETEVSFEGAIISTTEAQQKLNQALEEQLAVQEQLRIEQENERKLSFLEKQLDLVETINKAGLNVQDILGGLKLGPGASIPEMIAATNKLVSALITQTNANLVGITGRRGIGFQAGTPANTGGLLGLGFKIPSGYPNDSYGPMYAQSGEEMLVTPQGTSIEDLVFSRLSNLLNGSLVQGSSVTNNYNFNMTVNSGADANSVIRQYGVMRGLIGA